MRPTVIAVVESWHPDQEEDLRTIRAELRGLGAVLEVYARNGAWSFGPDDSPEAINAPSLSFEDAPRISVIDENGLIRFSRKRIAPDTDVAKLLATALSTASQAAPSRAFMMTRRDCVLAGLLAGFTLVIADACASAGSASANGAVKPYAVSGDPEIVLNINGADRKVSIEPDVTLLDALRERLELTGTKKGCDQGQCGACTVLIDGRRVLSCLTLAVAAQGAKITTIEGLAKGNTLHPMQAAFLAEDAFQCGYCTPGQIMSAVGLLSESRPTSDEDIRRQMSGNICRCGAYPNIVRAVARAQKGE